MRISDWSSDVCSSDLGAASGKTSDAVLDRLTRLHPKVIDLSLGRVERLLDRLGNPERRLAPVVHVAGTNGKGSLVAFLRAMLEAAGRRVQVYTSPHLVRFHERIRLTSGLIDEGALIAQIGIASVRDRVGKSVEIPVVPASLKKKKETK